MLKGFFGFGFVLYCCFFLNEKGSVERKEILEVSEDKFHRKEIRFWGGRGRKWEIFSGNAQY